MPTQRINSALTRVSTATFAVSSALAVLVIMDAYTTKWVTDLAATGAPAWVLWLLAFGLFLKLGANAITRFAIETKRLTVSDTRRNLVWQTVQEILWITIFAALLIVECSHNFGVKLSTCPNDSWAVGIQILVDRLIKTVTLDIFDLSGIQFTACQHSTTSPSVVAMIVLYHLAATFILAPLGLAAIRHWDLTRTNQRSSNEAQRTVASEPPDSPPEV